MGDLYKVPVIAVTDEISAFPYGILIDLIDLFLIIRKAVLENRICIHAEVRGLLHIILYDLKAPGIESRLCREVFCNAQGLLGSSFITVLHAVYGLFDSCDYLFILGKRIVSQKRVSANAQYLCQRDQHRCVGKAAF